MQDFRELHVWQKAHELTLALYKVTRGFPVSERYGLVSQIRRATISIEANIAEGCGRDSARDTARFFQIGLASGSEVQCLMMVARDLGYADADRIGELLACVTEIKRMLASLIRKVRATRRQDQSPTNTRRRGPATDD